MIVCLKKSVAEFGTFPMHDTGNQLTGECLLGIPFNSTVHLDLTTDSIVSQQKSATTIETTIDNEPGYRTSVNSYTRLNKGVLQPISYALGDSTISTRSQRLESSSMINVSTTTDSNTGCYTVCFSTTTAIVPTASTTTAIVPTATTTFTDSCNDSIEILQGDTCISKNILQMSAVNALRNATANTIATADALSLYFNSIASPSALSDSQYVLSPDDIDSYVDRLKNVTLMRNTKASFILAQDISQFANIQRVGATFTRGIGGAGVGIPNGIDTFSSIATAAALLESKSLSDVKSFSMLIIDSPNTYRNIDNSTKRNLVSSVIVAAVQRDIASSNAVNISLYFQVLPEYKPSGFPEYFCSFYDTTYQKWNDFGCTHPTHNESLDRYECNCNHTTTFALVWSPKLCQCNTSEVLLPNCTCITKPEGQEWAVEVLKNTTNSTVIADALSVYISAVAKTNETVNQNNFLTVDQIDYYVNNMTNVNVSRNTDDSILLAKQPYQGNNETILGASFLTGSGGEIISTLNVSNVSQSYLSAAAIVSDKSLIGATSLNILIIDKPTTYETVSNSTEQRIASSVIVVGIQRGDPMPAPFTISLYFQVLSDFEPKVPADYFCSFYDTSNHIWNESGCTKPTFKNSLNRYECSCNHTTTFALIWLPKVPLTRYLNSQDIASLVFQSISICCFIAVIIHAIVIRFRDPIMSLQTNDLPPLMSCAVTMILFIFFIALAMTTYTKTSSEDQTSCFLSSSVLMFFVYFFIIFMFCIKTSVAYFNYLRFVCLFPQPSYQRLFVMILISFFISIIWVSVAAGLNSNPSYNITQLYPYKFCWFTRGVIYYFLTIPAGVFLLINTIVFIRVALCIINHARQATSPHQLYKRMKQCVIILLLSSATQGIGWLFGPFLTFINSEAGNILGWFFVIFNGLEGLWVILLYIVIRSLRMDKQRYRKFAEQITTSTEQVSHKYGKYFEGDKEYEDIVT
ncbi:unnamed protein product [Rotaria socialis]|uniref:G-protein coupled receptors family 2 profile 2 domain-containing protein n=2 Tax=Rotaria socialis TaxID=392032 RepID=A0A821L135_9BILA|nr:unnamed protein product [Rotaria socialis]